MNRGNSFMKIILIIFCLLVAFILANIIYMLIKNNITPKNLGVTNGQLKAMPKSPNAVSTEATEEDKKVEPLKFKGDINKTRLTILNLLKNYEGAKVITSEKNYIYVVFSTKTMKYKDDVEFYLNDKTKLVQFRSASRVGYSDMGMNRKRYENIVNLYN